MHASPRESRSISNDYGRKGLEPIYRFSECLDAIKNTCGRTTLDCYTFIIYSKYIAFRSGDLRRYGEFNITKFLFTLLRDRWFYAYHVFHILLKEISFLL